MLTYGCQLPREPVLTLPGRGLQGDFIPKKYEKLFSKIKGILDIVRTKGVKVQELVHTSGARLRGVG